MAQNTTVNVPGKEWTQLSDANITAATFQNIGETFVLVKGTTDATTPTTDAGALRYNPGQGERNVALADLYPGLTTPVRIWVWATFKTRVVISHA